MVLGLGIALLLNMDLAGIRICRTALIIPNDGHSPSLARCAGSCCSIRAMA